LVIATVLGDVGRSLRVSISASLIAMVVGVSAGTVLGLARFRGRRLIATFVYTGMAIPTVVIGLVVALVLWRSGPLGSLGWIYTLKGMVIAQVLIATPLITGITMAAIQALPPELPDQLLALGASRRQFVFRLWVEAGAATIVGGNIHDQTRVLTTGIVEDVGRGDFGPALAYGAVLLGLAFLVNALLTSVQQRGAAWARS
jgi:tungstate transport system permease protein